MAEYFGIKLEDFFNTMEERFRPEGAKDVDATFGYEIKDEGKWKLTIKDEKMKIESVDDLSGCTATMKTDGETYIGGLIGKVDPIEAYTAGKVKIDGDLGEFQKTAKMFKKFIPPKKELTDREIILDLFGTIEARFQPEKAKELDVNDVTVGYDISGEDGGKWTATIKDGTCTLTEGIEGKPPLTFKVAAKDWIDLMLEKIDAASLLGAGKLTLDGDLGLALKMGQIMAKYILPGEETTQELLVMKKIISIDQRFATGSCLGKFFHAVIHENKFLAVKCPKCGKLQLPPREICCDCRVRNTEFVEVGPKGEARALEYVYFSFPDPLTGATRETPYGVLFMLLDGCKENEMFASLFRRDQLDKLVIGRDGKKGSRVRPIFPKEKPEGDMSTILSSSDYEVYFEIDE